MTTRPILSCQRPVQGLLTLLLLSLLSACGQSPSDTVIRKTLNQELQRGHLSELLEVTSIDNAERERESHGRYTVKVAYTLRAKRDIDAYNTVIKDDPQRGTMDRFAMLMTLAAVRQQFGDFKKGDTFKQQRRITLEKSQDGWRIPRPKPATPPRS